MKNSKISIIIPVYKVERYLDRCVNSVVNQTYTNLEIILIDDGSPDNCDKICDSWAERDKRIKVIHKENGGLSSARNTGLKVATGEYIQFVDSDDWIEKNTVEKLYELLINNANADIAACDYIIDKGAQIIKQPAVKITRFDKNGMFDYFFRVNGEKSNTGVWNKLIRSKILKDFSFLITLNEDVEASFDFYMAANEMIMTNQIYYHYFMNPNSITTSKFTKRDLEYLDVWDRVIERTKSEMPAYIKYATMYRKRANFTLLSKMFFRGYDKSDKEICDVHASLKKSVRKDYFSLLRCKMPISRKILMTFLII